MNKFITDVYNRIFLGNIKFYNINKDESFSNKFLALDNEYNLVTKEVNPATSIESVTGDIVDNTDPLNPLINLPNWVNYLRADRIGYVNMSNGNTYQVGSTYIDASGIMSSSSPTGLTNINLKFPSLTGVPYKRHMILFKVSVDSITSTPVTNASINNVRTKAKKGDIWTLTYDSSSNSWDLEAINSIPEWEIDEKIKTSLDSTHGWAIYNDNIITSTTPLVVTQGIRTKITNNAGTIINNQLPNGVTSWWNSTTNKITPSLNGDSYLVNLRFTAESSSTSGLADIELDVGGSLGVIDGTTISLRKGTGNSQRVSIKFDLYSSATFLTNGGEFYLNSIDGNTSIYDIRLKITRVHKAK